MKIWLIFSPVGWFGGGNSFPGAADPRGSGPHVVVLASLLHSGKCCCSAHSQQFCVQSTVAALFFNLEFA